MAGRINDDDIRTLRERARIADVVAGHTSLQRAGGGRLKGLCPFHEEKTPSFTVDPEQGLYHCFGCGAGGDTIGFLQQAEALSFPEAVERLARITGTELRYEELRPGQRRALGKRSRLAEALTAAADFYAQQLAGDDGAAARAYLQGRGVGPEAVRHFRLGWAPDRWDDLVRHLQQAGFAPRELDEAGLATPGRHGPVDRFRARVVFPILDKAGRDVIAFGGRVLPDGPVATAPRDGQPPKYINSSESPVYTKSAVLYGLNWARRDIVRRGAALVVEGYMDVIGLHLAGVTHAVATCGTALTAEHFRQLERFAPRVVLALDADDAGYRAADRARAMAEEAGLREVAVMALPPGQDPADLAAEGGTAAVEVALASTQTAVEFQIAHILRDAPTDTPEAQADAYQRTFPLLARLNDRFLRYRYIRDLVAPTVRLSADRIEEALDRHLRAQAGQRPVPAARPPGPGTPSMGGRRRRNPQMELERLVLQAAIQRPDLMPADWAQVSADEFTSETSRTVLAALRAGGRTDLRALLEALPDDDLRTRVRGLALRDLEMPPDPAHMADLVTRLRLAALERRREALVDELSRGGEQLDPDRRRSLTTALQELDRRKHAPAEKASRAGSG